VQSLILKDWKQARALCRDLVARGALWALWSRNETGQGWQFVIFDLPPRRTRANDTRRLAAD
jgi:hypothetical protein